MIYEVAGVFGVSLSACLSVYLFETGSHCTAQDDQCSSTWP